MKREEILFYLSEGKLSLYFVNSKEEKIFEIDTSLFFKCGEIANVSKCENVISEILAKIKFNHSYLKPNLIVLYNDVCYADSKYLYRCALSGFSYNTIKFIGLTKVVKMISQDKNIVVFDRNYYTLIERGEKCMDESFLGDNPIVIGKSKTTHIHYPEEDIIFRTLKSCFTNADIYDNMDVGDDVL